MSCCLGVFRRMRYGTSTLSRIGSVSFLFGVFAFQAAEAQVSSQGSIHSDELRQAASGAAPTPPLASLTGTWKGTLTSASDGLSLSWSEEFDLKQDSSGNITGTRKSVPSQNPVNWVVWNITGSVSGTTFSYSDSGIKSQGSAQNFCATSGALTVASSGISFSGNWSGSSCQGSVTASQATSSSIALSRETILSILANAAPEIGMFSLTPTFITGSNFASVAFASGSASSSNPATLSLSEPSNPSANGSPSPGGLLSEAVQFVSDLPSSTDSFAVPVFGMSCYDTTLESDWGTEPSSCQTLKVNGVTYAGTVKNPDGLTGTYCNAFIEEVALNGSGVTDAGQELQNINGTVVPVSQIEAADGTPPVAGATVARDRSVVPRSTTLVVDGFGSAPLTANDTGGGIVGYRLDQYEGHGNGVCVGFRNTIRVTTCSPASATCPGSAVQ